MDQFFYNLYRTRLYLPLTILLVCYLAFPVFRQKVKSVAAWINGRKTATVAVLCGAFSFLLCILVCYQGKSWGGDYSQYFAQARAVATGTIAEWYDKNIFIIDHSCVLGSDVYPWMWPLLLVPVYLIFHGFPIMLLKVYGAFFVSGGVILLVYILKRRVSSLFRVVLLTSFVMWNYMYIMDVNAIQADILSFFMVMLAINFIDLYNRNGSGHPIRYAILTGVAIYGAVMAKTLCQGLLLALLAYDAVGAFDLIIRKIKGKSVSILQGVFNWDKPIWIRIVPYAAYGITARIVTWLLPVAGGSYHDYFTFEKWRFMRGLEMYFGIFQSFFGEGVRPIISRIVLIVTVIFLCMTVIGIVIKWKKELYFSFYIPGMMLMLLFYDFYRISFVLTFYPLMILMSYYAVEEIITQVQKRNSFIGNGIQTVIQTGVLGVMVLTLAQSLTAVYAVQFGGYNLNESMTEDALDTYEYINQNISENSVIYFFKPRVLYLHTDVYAYYWDDDNPDRLDLADYVLMSVWNEQPDIQAVLDDSGRYKIIYQNDRFKLYQCINTQERR